MMVCPFAFLISTRCISFVVGRTASTWSCVLNSALMRDVLPTPVCPITETIKGLFLCSINSASIIALMTPSVSCEYCCFVRASFTTKGTIKNIARDALRDALRYYNRYVQKKFVSKATQPVHLFRLH